MNAATAVTLALSFCWLGMVLAISFVETPLRFRSPDVTTKIGLGIGQRVFRALNGIEAILAIGVVSGLSLSDLPRNTIVVVGAAVVALAVQLFSIRPTLNRQTAKALAAGPDAPAKSRSQAQLWYVGIEVIKAVTLLVGGVLVLRGL